MRQMLGVLAMSMALGLFTLAKADITIYNSNPTPLPASLTSLGYQATQTAEFGELIQFATTYRDLKSVTVSMVNWAYQSMPESAGYSDPSGFSIPLTLNLYSVDPGYLVGGSLGTVTVTATIPWRPEPDPSCGGTAYKGSDGVCHNGALSQVTFDFSALRITLPDQIIFGLAYSTETWGAHPTGVTGPYDSLNFGLNTDAPSVGSNPAPGTAYWNTSTAAWYADNGDGGVGIFRQDTGWAPYNAAATFTAATPEPGSILLLGTLLVGVGAIVRKRKSA